LRDEESDNPMDLVRLRWTWHPSAGRYEPEPPEKVPGEQVGQEQLHQLYADLRPEAFEGFLTGLWVETPAPARRAAVIVQFDAASRRIAINDGDILESFAWIDTVRTLFDRIVAVGESETVSRLHRTFSIRATGASTITVSIRGDNEWDARDLSLARISARTAESPPESSATAVQPRGDYLGTDGSSILFEPDRLVWSTSAGSRQAVWVSFALDGRSILTLRFCDDVGETRSWLLTREETRDKTSVTRTLTLTPVNLTASGWEETAGDTVELAQSEKLSTEKPSR
jgi:hypothetical protein